MPAFDVLADPVRRRILELLAAEERAANEVVEIIGAEFGISQPSVSQHLKVLRDRGLVQTTRQGTTVTYSLADPRLVQALDLLRAVMRERIEYRASLVTELV